jgi:hypothetical protein
MISESGALIDAAPGRVWDEFSDVERWPEWASTFTTVVGLDGPELAVGRRFEIKQPRLPKLVWEVTELAPGTSWTWVQRSPGGFAVAQHEVVAESDAQTRVRQSLEQRGPIGALVGLLMRSTTQRYLDAEALGLKARCEQPAKA